MFFQEFLILPLQEVYKWFGNLPIAKGIRSRLWWSFVL